jgi:acyl-CoA synthetase (AMP-forming)/AMP-acid ligase II
LAHFLNWYTKALQLTASDRVTMFSGLAHDPLLRDVLTPLWIGGTLCIPDQEALALGRVGAWMNEQKITLMHLTPPLVDVLTVGPETSQVSCPSLRYAVFGGESLRPSHLDRIKRVAPHATCVNGYGTTETPQIMSLYVVPPELSSNGEQVSIGQGIDGVQILVLNHAGQLAGIGELGEIYIRTPYLTLGYVNDAALTSARFLPNPFGAEAGDRMYRTGDLGRYRPDGTLEFMGREDSQIKLRGYRIELGEIEAVLRQQPAVQEAVVLCREDTPGEKYLVAYVVAVEEHLAPSELRAVIASQLPEYMMPGVFVMLGALPLTPIGKVDTRALPAPEAADRTRGMTYVAPRTPIEVAIAIIWQEVLKLDQVGIHDNFFDLGGHSLLATQVVARMRESLHVDFQLRQFFQAPTLKDLAGTVEILQHSTQNDERSTYNTEEDRSEIVL